MPGVMAQELSSGRLQPLYAKAVILATGGLGRMYQPSTSAFFRHGGWCCAGLSGWRSANGYGDGPVPSPPL